ISGRRVPRVLRFTPLRTKTLLKDRSDRLAGFCFAHGHTPYGSADGFEEHEPVPGGSVCRKALLVAAHCEKRPLDADIGHASRQTGGLYQVFVHAGQVLTVPVAGEACGGEHSGRDGPSVLQVVVGGGLQGVAYCMAVVQDLAQPAFQLVLGYNLRLEPYGVQDERLQRVEVACAGGTDQAEVVEEISSREEAHLDRLGEPVGDLTLRQSSDPVQVCRHQAGLYEGADQVLAFREVDPDLATDGAVHHGEKGSRQHDEVYAPHVGTRDEAPQIPDYPATEGEDRTVAGQPQPGQAAEGVSVNVHALGGFAGGNLDLPCDAPSGSLQGFLHPRSMQWPHRRVGEDRAEPRFE